MGRASRRKRDREAPAGGLLKEAAEPPAPARPRPRAVDPALAERHWRGEGLFTSDAEPPDGPDRQRWHELRGRIRAAFLEAGATRRQFTAAERATVLGWRRELHAIDLRAAESGTVRQPQGGTA